MKNICSSINIHNLDFDDFLELQTLKFKKPSSLKMIKNIIKENKAYFKKNL